MLLSVVIPTYNRAHLISKAIKSVLVQKYSNWELIIADDASTDNISIVLGQFIDQRIKYFRTNTNGGNAIARNLGIKHASGDYVLFLDSDDQFHPDFLQEMNYLIKKSFHPDFLWCNVNRVSVSGKITPLTFKSGWKPQDANDAYTYFLKGIYFGTDFGFTVKRTVFDKVGMFDEQLRVSVDTDFILRLAQYNCTFSYTNKILIDTYDHTGLRVRNNIKQKAFSYRIIYAKHKSTIENSHSLKYIWLHKLMWLHYAANEKEIARCYLNKLFKYKYFKSVLIGLLYELFPCKVAVLIHKKTSKIFMMA